MTNHRTVIAMTLLRWTAYVVSPHWRRTG